MAQSVYRDEGTSRHPLNAPQRFGISKSNLDAALVSLTVINPTPDFAFPTRRLLLRKSNTTVPLGRMSKKNGVFAARQDNGWIDSAVMSRDHAKLIFDPQSQVDFSFLLFNATNPFPANSHAACLYQGYRLTPRHILQQYPLEKAPSSSIKGRRYYSVWYSHRSGIRV
jgi:hypothetical protein